MTEVSYPEYLEEDGKHLIGMLLERDPVKRPKFDGIRSHPWMSGISFDPLQLKEIAMPDWIINHAAQESNPKTVRRSSMMTSTRHQKKELSLTLFIRDICTQMVDVGNKTDAENAAARWMSKPSPKTVELFEGWQFVSEDAKSMEMNTSLHNIRGFLSRIRSRRGTA